MNLQYYSYYSTYSGGVSASGITGNAIYNNGGVGVEVQGSQPPVLTISGNDIYQNTTYELRNDSGITIIANNNYWGEPTTDEFNAGQLNLSRIYDSHDNAGVGQVLIQNIRTTPALQAPHFITQPQTVTALPGDTITLSASVSGTTPIAYQWYQNGGIGFTRHKQCAYAGKLGGNITRAIIIWSLPTPLDRQQAWLRRSTLSFRLLRR